MKKDRIVRRYIIFFFGLLFNAFGVAFVTKAALGTSPIASIPYSLSLVLPRLSMGNWVILYNWLLIALQWLILRRRANKAELLVQVIITVFFGYFTDLSLFCLKAFCPESYLVKLISLLCGCVIIAFGAWLEVIADVAMLAADGFVRAIARVSGKEYGSVRVISDISMSAVACVICLVFLRALSGVREGTVIAALITGNIVKLIARLLKKPGRALVGLKAEN